METVGLLPAAGRGTRFLPFRCIKELLRIGYDVVPTDLGDLRPKLLIQYALNALVMAGVAHAYVIIADDKLEIVKVLSDGSEFNLPIAYLHQREALGLPAALDCAYPWVRGRVAVLALPDSIASPPDSARVILSALNQTDADVVLGVFPTEHPEDLCPVAVDDAGRVVGLFDKQPPQSSMRNTWGVAAWRPSFAEFMHSFLLDALPGRSDEVTLAEIFSAAMENGMTIRARVFENGAYWDIGKSTSFLDAIRAIELPMLLSPGPPPQLRNGAKSD